MQPLAAANMNKSEATPRLSRGRRGRGAFRRYETVVPRSPLPGANVSSIVLITEPGRVEHRRAELDTRCAIHRIHLRAWRSRALGRFGARLSSRGGDACGIKQGSRTPSLAAYRCNRGSRTLDLANRFACSPLSYIAVGGEGSRSCGTHSSRAAARQCGSEPQPLTRNACLDLGTAARSCERASSRILDRRGRRIHFRLPTFHECFNQ